MQGGGRQLMEGRYWREAVNGGAVLGGGSKLRGGIRGGEDCNCQITTVKPLQGVYIAYTLDQSVVQGWKIKGSQPVKDTVSPFTTIASLSPTFY